MKKYPEYKQLDLPKISKEIELDWKRDKIFEETITSREGRKPFVFYEGPPSANGLPGIHHVMSRTIKDIFCRYKTLQGFQVKRKAGWDTHGLPVELGVEKALGITKEDIGKTITIEQYNEQCKKDVLKYTDIWRELTEKMGYWVDLDHPYITYENKYVETVWYLLSELYKKGLLYKGYTIQPYSPAAGTGLSSHELNQPGCYKTVKDTTVVAQFQVDKKQSPASSYGIISGDGEVYFLAWTTTPWTLPSNTALAVGKQITYVKVKTFNPYTFLPITVILAKDLMGKYFPEKNAELKIEDYKEGDKNIPYQIQREMKGSELEGIRYHQLMSYAQPTDGDAFRVIIGDFVSTEDGTGIVHIAPSFGSDDFRVAKQNGIGSLTLVDKQGKFTDEVKDYAGALVKEAYETAGTVNEEYKSIDVRIAIRLKEENKAFKVEKYEHTYPHCWRTDKPILYYPLDSWFIKTTAVKDRMIELNKTINWKPESTGTGRFGNWLNNLMDWNLSRSRFWGIPIPIWRTEDQQEEKCIGSVEILKKEIEASVKAGFMSKSPLENFSPGDHSETNYKTFDLHRPYADDIILVSPSGKKMFRETDLIDVWFDSGAMPYAQLHYPFENKELIDEKKYFPADYIAEGVDQTRGWFFTLHAIAVMLFDSVAYKNVVSNGLVLDKDGVKMSKRLGNVVDPFETLNTFGADATRWYLISNAQPWDDLKFNLDGLKETQRKFFGTLYNTYSFFSLYANIDKFSYSEEEIKLEDRPEIDRWILSSLNTLIKNTTSYYEEYEPTKATRAIMSFVDEDLSNWYVRLCRRRFWKGDYSSDKVSAYQTLYTCLEKIAFLMSPVSPFFADRLFMDLNSVSQRHKVKSIHVANWPELNEKAIDKDLEERMSLAQKVSSMVLSLRKKENIRVRQPLTKIMIPVPDPKFKQQLDAVKDLILSEVNVKNLEYLEQTEGILVKKIKANFKELGPVFGKKMKSVASAIASLSQKQINELEQQGHLEIMVENENIRLEPGMVEITSEDIPGWTVTSQGKITVALDISITAELKDEGIAREIINRIQNLRKEKDYEVTDKISLKIQSQAEINSAINNNLNYICSETLAESLEVVDKLKDAEAVLVEVDDSINTYIFIDKFNGN